MSHTYGCLGCNQAIGKWGVTLQHMRTCCPDMVQSMQGVQQTCMYGNRQCILPKPTSGAALQKALDAWDDGGGEADQQPFDPKSPIGRWMTAAITGDAATALRMILENFFDVNAEDNLGWTAAHHAASNGQQGSSR